MFGVYLIESTFEKERHCLFGIENNYEIDCNLRL